MESSVHFTNRLNASVSMKHMGNAFAVRENGQIKLDVVSHSEKTDLSEYFQSSKLLRADSDVVNLMLFDHQIELHSLLIEARYRERISQYWAGKNGGNIPESTLADTDKFIKKLVRYMLFADEVSLDVHTVKRNTEFEKDFFANKRVDADGNSLPDFDLKTRLFKNRLSYMIYSQGFENAPQFMKDRVYKGLWDILTPKTAPEGYDYFDEGEREQIVSILRASKDDLPDYWKG